MPTWFWARVACCCEVVRGMWYEVMGERRRTGDEVTCKPFSPVGCGQRGPALASCFLLASCFTRCPASAPVSSQVQLHCTNATELASKDESIGRMGWARWRCVKSSRSQLPSLALFLSCSPAVDSSVSLRGRGRGRCGRLWILWGWKAIGLTGTIFPLSASAR